MSEWLNISLEIHYTNSKESLKVIIGIKITQVTLGLIITRMLDISAEFYTKPSKPCGVIRLQADILK